MLNNTLKTNAALNETVVAFDPQLPLGDEFVGDDTVVPSGVEFIEDGKAILRYYAPVATDVAVRLGHSQGRRINMEKQADGVWHTIITQSDFERPEDKYSALFFEINGVYALNPMAPIGWSHCHPINLIDFPSEDADFYLMKDVPHGTVARDYYYSKTCGCFKSCLVYTPPGYNLGEGENLPVLYLQHGYGENETSWTHLGKVNWIMDNLLANGKAQPCLIVMNNGMAQTESADGSREWNPYTMERLLIDDCIPYIESHYRVSKDKWHRAMAGLSMGSMQTSITTLNNPELFGYVGIFSGFLGRLGPDSDTNDHFAAFDHKQKLFDAYKLFFRCMGDKDQFIDQYNNESAMLADKGLVAGEWHAYRERIYNGGHDWNVWRQCVKDFLSLVFK